jgi:hypothetical protein
VACPYCGADAGTDCRTRGGRLAVRLHRARVSAYARRRGANHQPKTRQQLRAERIADQIEYLTACTIEAWAGGDLRAATWFARRLWVALAEPFADAPDTKR